MRASQCKTLSSAFVITAVVVAFCLTAAPRALAQGNAQAQEDASSALPLAAQKPKDLGSSAEDQSIMKLRDLFSLLVVLVALAAYLRLRIEWSKKLVRRRHRWLVIPMLVVEAIIAVAGYMLVYTIWSERRVLPLLGGPELPILGTFVAGVGCLGILHALQLVFDINWICKGARVPSGFLDVEAQTNGKTRRMKIRFADIVTMTEGDDNKLTVLKLKPVVEITVNKSWAQWKRTREFER